MVTVVWETWMKHGSEDEGLELTRRIWMDMTRFQGYLSHLILRDEDEKGRSETRRVLSALFRL